MINCYHWLMCLSIFFQISPEDINKANPQYQRSQIMQFFGQAWIEYDEGYSEICPEFKMGQPRRQDCFQRARQRLREWLDEQAETCIKTSIPSNSSLTTRSCRPGADAVFSYVVGYRESQQ